MSRVYAVVNQKGGVGKTTTAVNLAAYMALKGSRVLLIDLDPQSNATSGVGVLRGSVKSSVYDTLVEGKPIRDSMVDTCVKNLSLLPATLDLAGAEMELMSRISRETCLRAAINTVRHEFDVILIDAPPSLGLLTLNALTAADAVIIPLQTEYYALEGVTQLLQTIELVKRHLNPSLEIEKVILTMYDYRTRMSKQIVAEVQDYFKGKVASKIVPRNVRLSEAPSHGLPIALYEPKSQGAMAYEQIAQEVLDRGKTRIG